MSVRERVRSRSLGIVTPTGERTVVSFFTTVYGPPYLGQEEVPGDEKEES